MKYANMIGWSDIDPFEVVRNVSAKCVEIREMDAERDESVKMEFVPGGFSAICLNSSQQKWVISSNPENKVFKVRLHKDGYYRDPHGRKFLLRDEPVKYYDYNF